MSEDLGPSEFISSALLEAEKVAKKQKTCAAKTSGTIYKLINHVQACIDHLAAHPDADVGSALDELVREIDALDAVAQITSDTKELHGAVAKLSKVLDKGFSMDICGALRGPPLDRPILDRVVAEHLYQEGAFEVGDAFVQEAHVAEADALKAPYTSMYAVVAELGRRNLAPALAWAEQHREALRAPSGTPSWLEFSLHRLAFLQCLRHEGQMAALEYARRHFPEFQVAYSGEVRRLMGLLAFAKRAAMVHDPVAVAAAPLKHQRPPPYPEYLGEGLWENAIVLFKRQSCALLGQAQDSPLLVTVAAGAAALPTLLKLASVVAKTQPASMDIKGPDNELPVEVPLGREFVFHSIFACPVSREQSSPDNPPMMLPCGHCICKQSILKIAKSSMRAFKCPYCPIEATMQQCMELHFPDKIRESA